MTTSTTMILPKLVQEYLDAFNAHDPDKYVSYYADNCTMENLGSGMVFHGKQELKNYYMGLIKAFPDIKLEFKNMFRMGDQAASQWVMTGTNTGSMAMRNMPEMPPSNKKFSIKGAGFIQLQNEKIVMETEYYNALDFMMQLGMMPNMMQGSMEGNSSGSAVKMTQGSDEARTPG